MTLTVRQLIDRLSAAPQDMKVHLAYPCAVLGHRAVAFPVDGVQVSDGRCLLFNSRDVQGGNAQHMMRELLKTCPTCKSDKITPLDQGGCISDFKCEACGAQWSVE